MKGQDATNNKDHIIIDKLISNKTGWTALNLKMGGGSLH